MLSALLRVYELGPVSWTGNRTPIPGIVHRQSAINNKLAPKPAPNPNPNPNPNPTLTLP